MQTVDGKRHTITVQAESVYDAAVRFLGRDGAAFPGDRELPKIDKDTVFEVRPLYSVTQPKLMEWANKKANLYTRSRKFRSGDEYPDRQAASNFASALVATDSFTWCLRHNRTASMRSSIHSTGRE